MVIHIIVTIGVIYAIAQRVIYREMNFVKYKWKSILAIIAAGVMVLASVMYYSSIEFFSPIQLVITSLLLWQLTIAWYKKPTILEIVWILIGVVLLLFPFLVIQTLGYITGLVYMYHKHKQVVVRMTEIALFAFIGLGYVFTHILSNIALEAITMAIIVSYMLVTIIQLLKYVLLLLKNVGKNSVTDALTGLYNRGWFFKKLEQIGEETEVGLIFGDIDNFKKLNDTKGHEAGDKMLQKVANIFQEATKDSGYAVRYGGEEMVGVITQGNALQIAEKIRSAVESRTEVTISLGVFIGKGKSDDIVRIADERMYNAKNTGKNRVVSADTETFSIAPAEVQ